MHGVSDSVQCGVRVDIREHSGWSKVNTILPIHAGSAHYCRVVQALSRRKRPHAIPTPCRFPRQKYKSTGYEMNPCLDNTGKTCHVADNLITVLLAQLIERQDSIICRLLCASFYLRCVTCRARMAFFEPYWGSACKEGNVRRTSPCS